MIEHYKPIEPAPTQEGLIISAESLWKDNHSTLAETRRQEFEEARIRGQLIGVDRCSDARVSIVGNSISVGTISAAGTPSLNLVKDRGLAAWISLSHFDGDTVKKGRMPEGCGGLAAKAQIGNDPGHEGIEKYVSEIIKHKDPIIQTVLTAEVMASQSEKPVLAAAQDHLSHMLYPVALFQMKDGQMTSVSAVRHMDVLEYDPERMYENGIPTIGENHLPEVFVKLLEQNRREMQSTLAKYPNLHNMQKVQKPRMVIFSTDIRSAKIKYPEKSSIPGSMFKVFVPREKIDGGVHIPEAALLNSLNQKEYPISHAAANFADQDKPFSNTDTVIIETASMDESMKAARTALEFPWMKKWIALPERKIIAVQTIGGVISNVEEVTAESTF